MSDPISIALSGLLAQGKSLSVSASNIANISTVGSIPTPKSPNSNVYKPLKISYTSLMANGSSGGVIATISKDNSYSIAYDPSSIYANAKGFIAVPKVDLAKEIVSIMQTKEFYKANLAVIKTQKEMLGELLNSII